MTSPPPEQLFKTPLHAAHVALGARMTPFGGWDMPLHYGSQVAEHKVVREAVGMFDVSHMGQVRFTGARTCEFLQHIVPGNIARLADGGSLYTQLTMPLGGIVDDLIITRLGPEEYFTVVNASTRPNDVLWMLEKKHALGFHDVKLTDESEQWAMIAVQGPDALALAERILPGDPWTATKAFTMWPRTYEGQPHLVSRTGYTGESGVELLCPAELAETWWKRFHAAGAAPCGLGARDSLRLEMGYCLYGQDIDPTTSPVEAGLSWTIGWKKTEKYLGRDVIERHKAEKPSRVLTGLRAEGRRPLRHGEKVTLDGREVGVVTSGGFSPVLSCGIAMVYLDRALTEGKDTVVIQSREPVNAKIQKPPFVKVKSQSVG